MLQKKDSEVYQLQQECNYYKEQTQVLPQKSIVAEGKQNELIAVLNVIFEQVR